MATASFAPPLPRASTGRPRTPERAHLFVRLGTDLAMLVLHHCDLPSCRCVKQADSWLHALVHATLRSPLWQEHGENLASLRTAMWAEKAATVRTLDDHLVLAHILCVDVARTATRDGACRAAGVRAGVRLASGSTDLTAKLWHAHETRGAVAYRTLHHPHPVRTLLLQRANQRANACKGAQPVSPPRQPISPICRTPLFPTSQNVNCF